MFQKALDYLKTHSHSILATIVVLQNTKLLGATGTTVLTAISALMEAFGAK